MYYSTSSFGSGGRVIYYLDIVAARTGMRIYI